MYTLTYQRLISVSAVKYIEFKITLASSFDRQTAFTICIYVVNDVSPSKNLASSYARDSVQIYIVAL